MRLVNVALMYLLLSPTTVAAQNAATVAGEVLDETGAVLRGVLRERRPRLPQQRCTRCGDDGRPHTGAAVELVPPLVSATGAEIGMRTVRIRGVQSTLALWYLTLDSELLFVGDAGTTEAGRPSRRFGFEWSTYAPMTPWLTADADLAYSRTRFRDDDPAGDAVAGALDRVVSAGVAIEPSTQL